MKLNSISELPIFKAVIDAVREIPMIYAACYPNEIHYRSIIKKLKNYRLEGVK